MKKWLAALVMVVATIGAGNALVGTRAEADAPVYVWQPLKFRTTLTSSTTPTYASKFGAGANSGTAWIDSSTFMASNTAVTATAGVVSQAGLCDTSAAFTLDKWTPGPWQGHDTLSVVVQGAATASVVSSPAPSDSVFGFIVAVGPAGISPNGVTETGDTLTVVIDGSVDGNSWVQLVNAPGVRVAEVGSGNSWFATFYTSGKVLPNAGKAVNYLGWPALRARIYGDESASMLGDYVAKVGYFSIPSDPRQR